MSEREPATLEFLARQQDRMLAELASLLDDVNVLTAIVQRLDNSHRPNDPTSPILIRMLRKAGAAITATTAAPALSRRPRWRRHPPSVRGPPVSDMRRAVCMRGAKARLPLRRRHRRSRWLRPALHRQSCDLKCRPWPVFECVL
jgi:hypothetical protein